MNTPVDELTFWKPVQAMHLCLMASLTPKQQQKLFKNLSGLARLWAEKGDWVTANVDNDDTTAFIYELASA
jgi:hypothetical protein